MAYYFLILSLIYFLSDCITVYYPKLALQRFMDSQKVHAISQVVYLVGLLSYHAYSGLCQVILKLNIYLKTLWKHQKREGLEFPLLYMGSRPHCSIIGLVLIIRQSKLMLWGQNWSNSEQGKGCVGGCATHLVLNCLGQVMEDLVLFSTSN